MSLPKGKLIAIGGAEDKGSESEYGMHRSNLNFFELGILRRIMEEAGGPASRIEVVTTASSIPYEVGNNYMDAFGKIGCTNIGVQASISILCHGFCRRRAESAAVHRRRSQLREDRRSSSRNYCVARQEASVDCRGPHLPAPQRNHPL